MSVALATRLVEPDHWTTPAGPRQRPTKVRTFGPEVASVCADAGFAPDPQQELMLDLTFAVRPDGSPEAFEVAGIATRQNLKTGWLIQSTIGFVQVLEIPEVMWTSNELASAHDAQRTIATIMRESPLLRRRMLAQPNDGVYEGKQGERIELREGRTIWFRTRTANGGRGLGKRRLIMDEWFAGQRSQIGALGPIMAAQFQPQILYASSAPKADSHELHDLIRRGRAGSSPEMTFCEWAAPFEPCARRDCRHPKDAAARGLDCALDREHLLVHANPTLSTGRITMRTLLNLRQVLPPEEYMREVLGWGDAEESEQGAPAIDETAWGEMRNPAAKQPKRAALYVDVAPDRSFASIGVAGRGRNGRTFVMTRTEPGFAWVGRRLERMIRKRDIVQHPHGGLVGLHPGSQAQVLLRDLKSRGIEVEPFTSRDSAESCATMVADVAAGDVEHLGQDELDDAVSNATTRNTGEAELWDRRDPKGANITPVVAASGAKLLWQRWAAEHDGDVEDEFL